jgi:hypothetical protein
LANEVPVTPHHAHEVTQRIALFDPHPGQSQKIVGWGERPMDGGDGGPVAGFAHLVHTVHSQPAKWIGKMLAGIPQALFDLIARTL